MACLGQSDEAIQDQVKKYYGERVKQSSDLKTDVCVMAPGSIPKYVRDAMKMVHEDIANKYYGCGLVVPEHLPGMDVLDLGSGAGHDCFILSKLVGENGKVVGLDMTDEQLEVARKYSSYHAEKFGYKKPNTEFVKGYIEKLSDAGLKDNTFDIIISNCVINLSPDKKAVLQEAFRVLKDGGEFYFSDVYADQDLPQEIRKHEVLWGECVAGALCWKELNTLAESIGFCRPRLVTSKAISIDKEELAAVVKGYKFVSATYRLYKLTGGPESSAKATYDGGIEGCKEKMKFDYYNTFETGKAIGVSGQVSKILGQSRFKNNFTLLPVEDNISDGELLDPFKVADAPSGGSCGSNPKAGCCSGGQKSSKSCCS